jgi:hypothetical protein
MKPTVFLISFVLPLFCFSQYTYKNLQPNFLDNNAAAYTYGNLRLYPVYAKESFTANFKNLGTYMPLQEAVQKKKVKITEKTSGGSVNNLTIENLSSDTIIVICGDVVKGGKQDRIIQEDVLLQPKSGKRDLKVFCVESGRWTASNGAAGKHYELYGQFAEQRCSQCGPRRIQRLFQQRFDEPAQGGGNG